MHDRAKSRQQTYIQRTLDIFDQDAGRVPVSWLPLRYLGKDKCIVLAEACFSALQGRGAALLRPHGFEASQRRPSRRQSAGQSVAEEAAARVDGHLLLDGRWMGQRQVKNPRFLQQAIGHGQWREG